MMHRVRLLAAAAAMSSFVLVTACDDDDDPSGPPDVDRTNFTATLSGTSEIPSVTTTANGTGAFTLFDDDSLTFTLQVASIDSVTSAHIHAGEATTASGTILFAFPATTPPQNFTAMATLHTGTITPTSSGFSNAFTWDSLLTRLDNGTVYVNVHTRKNAGGEIRGQITEVP
ncbi:MAG: CHRD domain-containing protein [Gemmatimonadota bacterium]